jgi:hypothetical protein
MIQNYGLHWRVDLVAWGRQNSSGALLGAPSRSPRAAAVDFREQRGIYALYSDFELLYVGQAGVGDQRLFDRLKAHRSDHLSERWDRFSWFGSRWVTQAGSLSMDTVSIGGSATEILDTLEALSIAIAEPRLNLQRGRWGEAQQYYQWWARGDDEEC